MRLPKYLKDLMEKTQNPKKILNRSRIGVPSSLESSMKRILRRFESNQNKSKQMKINDVFHRFTSKAYSAAKLCKRKSFISTQGTQTADLKISDFTVN